MVRHGFDRYFLFSIPPEIRTVEGLSAIFAFVRCEDRLCSQIKRDTSFATPGYLVLWRGESLYGAVCAGDAACKATAWSIDSADGVCAGRCGGDNVYPTMFRGKKQQGAGRFSAGTLFCVSSRRALRFCAPLIRLKT